MGSQGYVQGLLMTFRRVSPQHVESSDGFTLRSRDRYYYHYSEGDHVMQVNVEPERDPSTGDYSEEISESSLWKWKPPFHEESVSDEAHARIKRNVSAALLFLKIPHHFK